MIVGVGTSNITAMIGGTTLYESASISSQFIVKPRDTDNDGIPDIDDNCPNIAIYLKITRVFLSNCKFSSSLKRVERFILRFKYQGLQHLKRCL